MFVSERYGVEPERWIAKPWCWTLWNYFQLQELDRQRSWMARMQRQESAELAAIAFHEPKSLQHERQAALAIASCRPIGDEREALRARWESMHRDLMGSKLLS